jgi:hypothetical protein
MQFLTDQLSAPLTGRNSPYGTSRMLSGFLATDAGPPSDGAGTTLAV